MEINDIISSGLLELYVTGAATPEERIEVEQWAMQYPEVKQELENIQSALETYIFENAIQPGADVKRKIMSQIGATTEEETAPVIPIQRTFDTTTTSSSEPARVYTIPSYLRWAVAACIILLIGSVAVNLVVWNKYQHTSSDLQVAQNELQRQKDVANAMHKDMEVMNDKHAMPVALNGTSKAPDAAARIYWMKNAGGDVYVDPTNLPEAPTGMQYQLWAIVDGKPVDAGMITTPKGTYHIQKMKSFGKAEAFAITLEKAGGSPVPTMDRMYVMAKI
ncbi:MAG: anti-sigma factor domain-containing protein [Flavisolibacter sp.]